MISANPPGPFVGLPESDTTTPSKSARMVANVRHAGAAVGSAVAVAAGETLGLSRGALKQLSTPEGRQEIAPVARHGMTVGAISGACLGGLVGGVSGLLIGALSGAVAGGLAVVTEGARPEAAQLAAAMAPRGAAVGESVARTILHGVAHVQVAVSHLPGMRRIGHRIIYREQVKMEGDKLEKCHRVDDRVYRGSQPGPDAFKPIADAGFKTVINLRYETNSEADKVRALGMTPVYIPQAGMDAPTLADTLKFLKVATDPTMQPVYFHCYSGVDRTGTMAACYRIAVQGWTAQQAIEEAGRLGMVEDLDGAKIDFIRYFETYWKQAHPPGNTP